MLLYFLSVPVAARIRTPFKEDNLFRRTLRLARLLSTTLLAFPRTKITAESGMGGNISVTKTSKALKNGRKSSGRMASQGFFNPIGVHVGQRIRQRRTLLGMSQTTLGDAIGLTFQQVQKYERGANRVSSSRLFDLANILDVTVSYFFADMSVHASSNSPAVLMGIPSSELPEVDNSKDPMARRETLEFVRAFNKIAGASTRKQLEKLIKELSKSSI